MSAEESKAVVRRFNELLQLYGPGGLYLSTALVAGLMILLVRPALASAPTRGRVG